MQEAISLPLIKSGREKVKRKATGLEVMIDEATGYNGTPEKAWREFFKFVDEYVFQPIIGSESSSLNWYEAR